MDFLDYRYKHHMDRAEAILRDSDELALVSASEEVSEKIREDAQARLAIEGPGLMQLAALHMQRATELREAHHAMSTVEAVIAQAQTDAEAVAIDRDRLDMERDIAEQQRLLMTEQLLMMRVGKVGGQS